MHELAIDREKVSVKPVLMVAGMLLAAVLGAVVTVRPAAHSPVQQRRPSVGVVVIDSPRAPAALRHSLRCRSHVHSPSTAVSFADWV
jgi:hypothetical protein